MAQETTHVVIAPKLEERHRIADDWQAQVGQIPGIEVLGGSGGILQARATPAALQTLGDRLGHVLNIEEAAPRGFEA